MWHAELAGHLFLQTTCVVVLFRGSAGTLVVVQGHTVLTWIYLFSHVAIRRNLRMLQTYLDVRACRLNGFGA